MTSLLASFKQTTRKTLTTGNYNPRVFQLSDINSQFPTAQVTGNVYLCPTKEAFDAGASNLNAGYAVAVGVNIQTLIDLGKDIFVGVQGNANDLLHFRLIKNTGTQASLGEPVGPTTGYVVVDNKVGITYNDNLYVSAWLS